MTRYTMKDHDEFRADAPYNYATVPTRFSLGFVPEGEAARQVFQGPLVPGPWAYLSALPTVIAAHPLPEDLQEVPYLRVGEDEVEVDGVIFRLEQVVSPRVGYPELVRVEA